MLDILLSLSTVAVVSLLAAISPGPDFFIVLKNSLGCSRRAGFLTAFGVATALIIHLTYTLVGIGVLIAESPMVYRGITYVGAAYLFYIGISAVIASFKKPVSLIGSEFTSPHNHMSDFTAFKQGFLTNALNPKCAVFFISLFSQFIGPDTTGWMKLSYGVVNLAVSLGWFLLLTFLVTSRTVMQRIQGFQQYIDRITGSALILLSMKLALI